MDWVVAGLPWHSLLVHFTVVVVPAAAACVVLAAVWPAARRRLGVFTPILALVALVAVPFTSQAGQWLVVRVEQTPLVEAHEAIGTSLLPWVIALFVIAVLQWVWYRRDRKPGRPRRPAIAIAIMLVAVVAAVGSVATVVRIGDTGAAAVWTGEFDSEPVPGR
ncbi:DUF2231 domain-containing protein [Glaciibacter superstes]|uniref:DUF2231 domain-containing protein n=1 Tax=Glaciibacter superstes TaxID=501023 RepID=UPI0003B3D57A|nr:DUF2231 domain-containing protein [Glaciibacter superstes]